MLTWDAACKRSRVRFLARVSGHLRLTLLLFFRLPLFTLTSLSYTHTYTRVTHLVQNQWMNNSISLCILINFLSASSFLISRLSYFFYSFYLRISLSAAHSLSSLLACASFSVHGTWIVRVSEPNSYEEAK